MLNKNIFYALAFGLLMTTNVNADNPGEEEVAPVAEVVEAQQEETVQEAAASAPVAQVHLIQNSRTYKSECYWFKNQKN